MKITFFFTLSLLLASCSNEYALEDELYACIDKKFSQHSLNLEEILDSLETLCVNEKILQSNSPADYRNYFQTNIDQGMLVFIHSSYLNKICEEVNLSYLDLERCALRKFDGETFDESKFGRISNLIDTNAKESGQITSGTVAEAHLKILTKEDFEHPFYRANVLLSLQNLYFNRYMFRDQNYIRPIPKKVEY